MKLQLHMKFGKVMRSKSAKMVFVTSIIRHKLCIIYAFFDFFFQRLFLTKNYILIAAKNLTRGPLYTSLVTWVKKQKFVYQRSTKKSTEGKKKCFNYSTLSWYLNHSSFGVDLIRLTSILSLFCWFVEVLNSVVFI